MLRRIKLYGPLAKFVGQRVLKAAVDSPAEAVRFLLANWPDLQRHMSEYNYRILVGSDDLPIEELHFPAGLEDIRIIPVVAGAGPTARIIAGVALIAASFAIPGSAMLFGSVALKTLTIGIGLSLTIGGVAELLSPVPQMPKDASDPRKSYSFSGIQNTNRQGTPVPVIYGETVVGSVVISAGIDIVQVDT